MAEPLAVLESLHRLGRFEGGTDQVGLRKAWTLGLNFQVWNLQGDWKQSWNSGQSLGWACTFGSDACRCIILGNGWNHPGRVWRIGRKKYEMPTFLWIEEEEPRGSTEGRGREGKKKINRWQYSESQGKRILLPSYPQPCLLLGFPIFIKVIGSHHPDAQVSKQVSFPLPSSPHQSLISSAHSN